MEPQDRDWLRSRALNVIGHELRTPASTVRGLAEVLATNQDPATFADLMPALLRNARRLESLVDDLLAATEVDTVLPVGPSADVDVNAAVHAEWGTDPGLQVAEAAAQVRARARPDSVRRILRAVLDNARTYGERPVVVDIVAAGVYVRATIDSPGPVLSAEDVRLALEPFWRGELAVTTAPGLGVGLAVARVLAQHEGGQLWVEPGPHGGLVTFLELPAA